MSDCLAKLPAIHHTNSMSSSLFDLKGKVIVVTGATGTLAGSAAFQEVVELNLHGNTLVIDGGFGVFSGV